MSELSIRIKTKLEPFGVKEVVTFEDKIPGKILLLKRQTWNTNRAVVLLELTEPPDEIKTFL